MSKVVPLKCNSLSGSFVFLGVIVSAYVEFVDNLFTLLERGATEI